MVSAGDNAGRFPASVMGRRPSASAAQHALHRPALGVPRAHLDARPVHLAAPNHEDTLRPSRDGVPEALLKPHRLSQYWVRPLLYYIILLSIYLHMTYTALY